MAAASWSGELAEADKDYFIAPKVNYKFDRLRQTTQQVPMNVTFEVEVDGESAGEKHETLQVRSINDCPFAVSNSEETLDDENFIAGNAALGWMFAAYVNENHPLLDKILQEALESRQVVVGDDLREDEVGALGRALEQVHLPHRIAVRVGPAAERGVHVPCATVASRARGRLFRLWRRSHDRS